MKGTKRIKSEQKNRRTREASKQARAMKKDFQGSANLKVDLFAIINKSLAFHLPSHDSIISVLDKLELDNNV